MIPAFCLGVGVGFGLAVMLLHPVPPGGALVWLVLTPFTFLVMGVLLNGK